MKARRFVIFCLTLTLAGGLLSAGPPATSPSLSVPLASASEERAPHEDDEGWYEYPLVVLTDNIDSQGNGTSVAQVAFKNTDTYSQSYDLWYWGASSSQQSNIQAWDSEGPLSFVTEEAGYRLYIYVLFRHRVQPGDTYTYWVSTDIQGMGWWSGTAWSRCRGLGAGVPVHEYRYELTLPSDAMVVAANPEPSVQRRGYVEWVFRDLDSWESAWACASYKLACPAGNTPIVLIHGWHGPDEVENSQLRDMYEWLDEGDSCDVHYATGINANQTLEEGALVLSEYIRGVREKAHVDKIIIIGYSRGGLNARAYVESGPELYHDDVSKVIMLGTPNAGATLLYTQAYLLAHMERGIFEYPGGDLLSTYELLPSTMAEFNERYRNPRNIPYYLIGGDGNPVIKVPPNDVLVRVDSVHSAPGSRNVYMQTHDVHGWDLKLPYRRSYVYPKDTYDACIRPALAGTQASEECFVTSSSGLSLSDSSQDTVHTPYQSDIITAGETLTHSIAITATTNSQFHLVWDQGDLELALLDPLGATIDPAYAESSPNVDFVSFEPDTIINYNMYAIADTIAGTWTLSVTANYTEPVDVAFSTFATLEPTLDLEMSTDKTLYDLNDPAMVTATLSYGLSGLPGANVEALIGRPDVVTETLTLYDDGAHEDGMADDGTYGNTYANTDVGGAYAVFVTAEGTLDSVPYARADEVTIQVSPETAQLTGTYSDHPEDADNNGRYEYLVTEVGVDVASAGDFLVSGILLGPGDVEIASTVHPVSLPAGTQTVPLRFDGDLIYVSGLDGPYTLTQVFLMDSTGLPIKLDEAYDAWVTAAYDHTKFSLNEVTHVPLSLKDYT